jgi:hypothetical protein
LFVRSLKKKKIVCEFGPNRVCGKCCIDVRRLRWCGTPDIALGGLEYFFMGVIYIFVKHMGIKSIISSDSKFKKKKCFFIN